VSKNTATEGVKDFIVNIIVVSIIAFLIGLTYILVDTIRNLLPGYETYAWTLIKLGLAAFVVSLILLNFKKIIICTGKLISLVFKKLFSFIRTGVKNSSSLKVPIPNIKNSKKANNFGSNLPPLSLLGKPSNHNKSIEHAEHTKRVLNKSFKDFNLDCIVTDYKIGPSITRYNLQMSSTTKIRELMSAQEDLSVRVKSKKLRILTTNGVLIEIPNAKKQTVIHRNIMDELLYKDLPQLTMACGRTANGGAYYIDLAKAPHLLVGGATGGGKSVCVNSLIVSLLMRNSPDDLKLIMIDPKVIEFEFYKDLPHLLFPVANTLDKSAQVIKWCVNEMNRRYEELRNMKRKNLADIPVNQRPFPIIVVVIDELAEITLSKKAGDLTDDLNSLARMARASGIHMILATQRPDKDAVPGQLKSNIPSAIALKVLKDYESRIILGQEGAEKLIGRGDMLISAIGEEELIRCQGSYLSDEQIESVVEWWKENYSEGNLEELKPKINFEKSLDEKTSSEEIQEENKFESEKPSTSQAELILRKNICDFRLSNDDDTEIQLPTIRELSNELNISTRQVSYILEQLKAEEWIKKLGETSNAKLVVTIPREIAIKCLENFQ